MVGVDVGAVLGYRIAPGSGTLAGTAEVAIAVEIGVAHVRPGRIARVAGLEVGRGASIEIEFLVLIQVAGKTRPADNVTAGIGRIARTERVDPVALAKAAIGAFR